MTQVAIHQRDKWHGRLFYRMSDKMMHAKENGSSYIICMHTEQLVRSKASAKGIQIETSFEAYFRRYSLIHERNKFFRCLSEKSEHERPGPARPMPTLLRGLYL